MIPASRQYSLTDEDIQRRDKLLERKEAPRFFQILEVDKWLQADKTEGQRKLFYLEAAAKVIQVFTALLLVLMPLAVYYLPTWVPWGIGLPIILGLTFLAYPKIKKTIEPYKRDQEFVPFQKKFLTTDSTKSLHPFGEWDLPSRDERLKSDKMAEQELHITRPPSGREVEEIVGLRSPESKTKRCIDLETTSFLDAEVANRFSGRTQRKEAWKACRAASRELERSVENQEEFEKKRQKLITSAYGGEYPTLDFPPTTTKHSIKSMLTFYQTLIREFEEAGKLHEEGSTLWKVNYGPWITYTQSLQPVYQKMAAVLLISAQQAIENAPEDLIGLFNRLLEFAPIEQHSPDLQKHLRQALSTKIITHQVYVWMFSLFSLDNEHGYEAAKNYLEQEQLERHLFKAIQDTRQVNAELLAWKASHSSKKLEAFEAQFKAIKEKDYMSSQQLALLKAWYTRNTGYADKALITIPKEIKHQSFEVEHKGVKIVVKDFWKELKPWMKSHPDKRYATPHELYDDAKIVHDAYIGADAAFTAIKKNLAALSEAEKSKKLDTFEEEVMAPLRLLTIRTKSKCAAIFEKFTRKLQLPAKPFVLEKGRRVEALLDRRLKQIDSEMLSINRARVWALRIPRWILLVVEAVVAIYFATPWIFWGISFLTLMGEGVSLYIDYKLGEMDEEKQSIKLHRFLLDYPDVIRIPGIRPDLIELQEIQGRYGLEGVTGTWANALKKGDKVLEGALGGGPARRKLHRDMSEERMEIEKVENERREKFKEVGQESSEKATLYLKRAKIQLLSDRRRIKNQKEIDDVDRRIQTLERTLKGEPITYPLRPEGLPPLSKTKRHTPSLYEMLTIKRQEIDDEMDRIAQEAHNRSMMLTEYKKAVPQFERLEKFLSADFAAEPIQKGEIDALLDAMEGERLPKTEEVNIVETLSAIKDIVSLTQLIKPHEHIERLRQVPVATLEKYARALRKLQRYQSYFKDKASVLRKIAQEEQWIVGSKIVLQQHKFIYDSFKQDPTVIDAHIKHLVELPSDQVGSAFKKMDPLLKRLIFPNLSDALRKTLQEEYDLSTGEKLLEVCKAEAKELEKLPKEERQAVWKKESFFLQFKALHPYDQKYVLLFLPSVIRAFPEMMEMYLCATKPNSLPPIELEIPPSRLDKLTNFSSDPFKRLGMLINEVFETPHGKQVHALYLEKGSSMWWRLPEGYRYFMSGEALIAASSQAPVDLAPYKNIIENSFFKMEPHRQREVFRALSEPFKIILKEVYERCTGEALLEASKSLEAHIKDRKPKEAQQIFSSWQQEKGIGFLTDFKFLDPYHQRYISHFFPSFIRAWIAKNEKSQS